ncbi:MULTISPECIES: hypothetical protein [unclassified Curtobacterium]|uniref:hypothetical protein n=1 Tax=unclassified Curtobacterium TaxID=257496 RepID=UPI00104A5436|nr:MULTISPECIES: hypothetical protein [unclassified Curtobacterium]
MTLVGINSDTLSTFPVAVATNDSLVTVERLVLERGKRGPATDVVVHLRYNVGEDHAPAFISLLVIVSAIMRDPLTQIELEPRVYDETAPVSWAARPEEVRIQAPLSAHYWATPAALTVDLRVTPWLGPSPTG